MHDAALAKLNVLPREEAIGLLLKACGSRRWAEAMAAARPFASFETVNAAAEHAANPLSHDDWLEAFSHHPRIGDLAPASEMASREQSGMAGASDEARRAFVEGNREYERRFGHVFLICATGKSAAEMLASLRNRMNNDPQTELRNAVEQQRQITRLRLAQLIYPERP